MESDSKADLKVTSRVNFRYVANTSEACLVLRKIDDIRAVHSALGLDSAFYSVLVSHKT
jgi:hypothetical protein